MLWLFLAILVGGYFLFKANESKTQKPQNQPNAINSRRAASRRRSSTAPRASSSKRPYIKCYAKELESIASSEWNNTEVLRAVHYELGFRSRKKAKVLRNRLSERLSQLEVD